MELYDGTINSIIAPNGTGKTTLMSILAGFLSPDSGEVIFDSGLSHKDVVLLLSGEKNLYMKNTVKENILYFSILRGKSKSETLSAIDKYKSIFPLYEKIKDQLAETLSYGQKRMAALFSAIISESKYIIIDEASEGLDMEHVNMLKDLLRHVKEGRVIIIASQDYDFAADISDNVCFLKDGKIAESFSNMSKEELTSRYVNLYGIKEAK